MLRMYQVLWRLGGKKIYDKVRLPQIIEHPLLIIASTARETSKYRQI